MRDAHVQGWRYQLAGFSNVVSDEVNAGAAGLVDRWFDAWAEPDAGARATALGAIAIADVGFRDRHGMTDGIVGLIPHIDAAQRFMPGSGCEGDGLANRRSDATSFIGAGSLRPDARSPDRPRDYRRTLDGGVDRDGLWSPASALRRPLILLSPSIPGVSSTPRIDWMSPITEAVRAGRPGRAAELWRESPSFAGVRQHADASEKYRQIVLDNASIWTVSSRPPALTPPAGTRLKEVKVPVLSVVGDKDPSGAIDVARIVASTVPHGRLMILSGAGHMISIERPAEIVRLLASPPLEPNRSLRARRSYRPHRRIRRI